MEKKLEVTVESAVLAYNDASDEQKQLLVNLFGQDVFRPKNVMERIKTFEDARNELGSEHPLVEEYETITARVGGLTDDLLAYLKLRIIVAALNEGWVPQFTEDEYRYYPWFVLYTNEEIEEMSEEQKSQLCRVVGRASSGAGAGGGLVYSSAVGVSTSSGTYYGSRLAFKTRELAEYAGKQFIEIYRDQIMPTKMARSLWFAWNAIKETILIMVL